MKIIFLSIPIFLFSCSEGLDDEESSQVFSATEAVLIQGSTLAASADRDNIEYTFKCAHGGDAIFRGKVHGTDLKYAVDFHGCPSRGITMTGSLDYEQIIDGENAKITAKFSGNLDYSGQVLGSCAMNLVQTSLIDSKGSTTTYVGNICGNAGSILDETFVSISN